MVERIRYSGWDYAPNVDKHEVKIHRGEPIEWPIFIVHDIPLNLDLTISLGEDEVTAYAGGEQLRVTVLKEEM